MRAWIEKMRAPLVFAAGRNQRADMAEIHPRVITRARASVLARALRFHFPSTRLMPDDRPSTNSHVALIRVCMQANSTPQREVSFVKERYADTLSCVCGRRRPRLLQRADRATPPPSTHSTQHVRATEIPLDFSSDRK